MNITIKRETLLKPLQMVSGVIEKRQTLPVLSNVLVEVSEDNLSLTGTDLEVEMIATAKIDSSSAGEVTIPAKKFMDICRALPEDADVKIIQDGERITVRSGKSRFTLSTLPASEFPNIDAINAIMSFSVTQNELKQLIDNTAFSMAQQDVRYYLNGLMLSVDENMIRTVATDGHRLAVSELEKSTGVNNSQQIILPRKGVLELARLLDNSDNEVNIQISSNHIRITMNELTYTSKLIDGKFPDYNRVIPKNNDKIIHADKSLLRQSLSRASILSNEKYRGIRLTLESNLLKATAHNPELEEAEEEIAVEYSGEGLEIGFNVNYLLDALAAIDSDQVEVELSDSNSSCLIHAVGDISSRYVVMPMRL